MTKNHYYVVIGDAEKHPYVVISQKRANLKYPIFFVFFLFSLKRRTCALGWINFLRKKRIFKVYASALERVFFPNFCTSRPIYIDFRISLEVTKKHWLRKNYSAPEKNSASEKKCRLEIQKKSAPEKK